MNEELEKGSENLVATCYRQNNVAIRYCNYQNELKSMNYEVTSTAIVAGDGSVPEDISESTVYFEFSDFGEKDIQNLCSIIDTRFSVERMLSEKVSK